MRTRPTSAPAPSGPLLEACPPVGAGRRPGPDLGRSPGPVDFDAVDAPGPAQPEADLWLGSSQIAAATGQRAGLDPSPRRDPDQRTDGRAAGAVAELQVQESAPLRDIV